jgi:4-hydroxybenzoate polyprenyltransferase
LPLHLSIFSSAFAMASGFIINSFYDLESDIINRPNQVIFKRYISQATCLNFYFFFNTVALVLSYFVSRREMLFIVLFSLALWFYSHKVKKMPFWGYMMATALTIAPLFMMVVLYRRFDVEWILYTLSISMIILARELLKSMLSERADRILGRETFPIVFGRKRTRYVVMFITMLSVLPVVPLMFIYPIQSVWWIAFAVIGSMIQGAWMTLLINKKAAAIKKADTWLKLALVVSVFSIALL